MATGQHISRRALFEGGSMTVAMMALGSCQAAAAPGERPSPLRRSYAEWIELIDAVNASDAGDDSPELAAMMQRIMEIEDQASAFEPLTVEDLHFKIIFADEDGLMAETPRQVRLVRGAFDAVGLAPRFQRSEI